MTDTNDNTTTDESSDHYFVAGKTGTGKTHRIGTELARCLTDETEATEWIYPKGEGERE